MLQLQTRTLPSFDPRVQLRQHRDASRQLQWRCSGQHVPTKKSSSHRNMQTGLLLHTKILV